GSCFVRARAIEARRRALVCLLLLAGFMGAGCKKEGTGATPATPAAAPPTQVVVVPARNQRVSEFLSLVGTLTANESVEVKAEAEGVVQEIPFQEGQVVEKGALLVKLDETKLASAVAEAEANFKLSEATFQRSVQLFKDKLISQQEYDQAAATYAVNQASLELKRRQLKDARVYAPFKGVLGARSISPGLVITRNTPLTWVIDLDPVKVEVNVPERFLSQLRIGQTVELNVAAFPGRKFKGEVYFIAPFVDTNTRTALVKARIPNPEFELKPGMFASLELTLTIKEQAVVIPEVALNQVLDGSRATIYVVDASQTVQLRKVALGVRLAGLVEVTEGLQAGENVVVEGVQKIGPGSKVKAAPKGAADPYLTNGISG
ncbi:MAG: efflux RND transporter periplasmic adaptor subunit, partial [Verrucomicrobiota bacterium]